MRKDYIIIDKIGNKIYRFPNYGDMRWQLDGLIWDYEIHGWIIKQDVYNHGFVIALKYVGDMFD